MDVKPRVLDFTFQNPKWICWIDGILIRESKNSKNMVKLLKQKLGYLYEHGASNGGDYKGNERETNNDIQTKYIASFDRTKDNIFLKPLFN